LAQSATWPTNSWHQLQTKTYMFG